MSGRTPPRRGPGSIFLKRLKSHWLRDLKTSSKAPLQWQEFTQLCLLMLSHHHSRIPPCHPHYSIAAVLRHGSSCFCLTLYLTKSTLFFSDIVGSQACCRVLSASVAVRQKGGWHNVGAHWFLVGGVGTSWVLLPLGGTMQGVKPSNRLFKVQKDLVTEAKGCRSRGTIRQYCGVKSEPTRGAEWKGWLNRFKASRGGFSGPLTHRWQFVVHLHQ